jgi:hypothetical protein
MGPRHFEKIPKRHRPAGEALAAYADAYSPKNAVWSTHSDAWPLEFNDEYLHNLPPHEQVLYALLHRDIKSSNNHKRIAVAPALLAVVARAARS